MTGDRGTEASRAAPTPAGFTVQVVPPPDDAGAGPHGGLKLDWRSEVGRTGRLVRWSPIGRGVDAGVAPAVARSLAAGLCAVGTVTGCTLDLPDGPEDADGWYAVPEGHACRLRRGWWQRPRVVGLVATRSRDVVERLFDDDGFPWALEQQLFVLSPPGVLPRLDGALVDACGTVPIGATLPQLAAAGVTGLLVAGVDGDVAGLYLLAPGWDVRVLEALAAAVVAAGGQWEAAEGAARWNAGGGAGVDRAEWSSTATDRDQSRGR